MSVLAGCGSSPPTPVATEGPTTTVTTSTTVATTAPAADAGTATAPPASTVDPAAATTTSPPPTSETTTTTSPPAPLPVDGPGVHGRVTAGPTCPVERPDQPCPPQPVDARVDAIDSTGHTAGTTTTDDLGRYAIALLPGGYRLRVDPGGSFPTCPDTPVSVTAGAPVTADIDCDTGIR